MVETQKFSTIYSIRDGGFWVCDRDRNIHEVLGLWEAEEFLRERDRGFDCPYTSHLYTVKDVQSNQKFPADSISALMETFELFR